MAVRIRLARGGAKKRPFFRIVAADARMKRDGRFLEKLGTFNPLTKELSIKRENIEKWLSHGASPSTTVTKLLIRQGFDLKLPFDGKKKEKRGRAKRKKKEAPKENES